MQAFATYHAALSANWKKHLRLRRREAAYVMRYSNGAVNYRDLEGMDPAALSEWSKAFEWILRKEYPDS